MKQNARIPGIDNFKLAAAVLVIAIHTSPLASFSPEADFILTRIAARTAVPFFFMVTGFFILPRALEKTELLIRYLKRIAMIYAAASILYLPIAAYAGHFRGAGPGRLLKMLLFDGLFYHLWYLPALLLGSVLVWAACRLLPLRIASALAVLLYLAGLPGDSYYGFTAKWPPLRALYDGIFQITEYTRNGIFYAPVFLLLGYLIFRRTQQGFSPESRRRGAAFPAGQPSQAALWTGFSICSALLTAEGVTLRLLEVQRHDSMYLFLPPLMYFLFSLLLEARGRSLTGRLPGDLPLLLYILHPLCIILVRGLAKLLHLPFLISNSLLHFLLVALSSFAVSWLLALVRDRLTTNLRRKRT